MPQNYSNHSRIVPMYHFLLFGIIFLSMIGSGVNLFKSFGTDGLYSASLIFVMNIAIFIMFVFVRTFPLKAQDRAIRAEENLRHYVMTGKLLHPNLTMRQIIGLRFASDEEYPELEKKAVAENLSEDDIKKAIKNWKEDTYRV
ncbi:MAG: DUF6526 family protein [bacterium]